MATIYPSNIHYKENGKFVDIDNTLEEKNDNKESLKLTKEELKKEALETNNNEINLNKDNKKENVQEIDNNINSSKNNSILETDTNSILEAKKQQVTNTMIMEYEHKKQ